jgi:hypothetical protein
MSVSVFRSRYIYSGTMPCRRSLNALVGRLLGLLVVEKESRWPSTLESTASETVASDSGTGACLPLTTSAPGQGSRASGELCAEPQIR